MADSRASALPATSSRPLVTPSRAWTVGCLLLLAFVALQAAPIDATTRARMSVVALPFLLLISVFACAQAARATRAKSRRQWRLLTLALALFEVGLVYRAYHVLATGRVPGTGSLEDVAYGLAVLTLVPVTLLMVDRFEAYPIRKARNTVDFFAMLVMALTLIFVTIALPFDLLHLSNPDMLRDLLLVAFPVFCMAMLAYLMAFKRGRWYADEVVLLLALCFGSVGVSLAVYSVGRGLDDVQGPFASFVNSMLMCSFVLLGVAAVYRLGRQSVGQKEAAPAPELPHPPGVAAQVAALVVVPGLLLYAERMENTLDRAVVVVAASVLAMLVVGRGILANVENRRLTTLSFLDSLTGLYNERYFRERLRAEIDNARHDGGSLALCLVDIDSFAELSRSIGYAGGDSRLRWFASTYARLVNEPDLIFRVGADEFARILPLAGAEQALDECRRLAEAVQAENRWDDWPLTFSAGVAVFPDHSADPIELTRLAEGALYWAKTEGPGTSVVYDATKVEALDSREHVKRVINDSHNRIVESLAHAVDARDPYTRHHSTNVAALVEPLAIAAGLGRDKASLLAAAALLHDVGKIGVPDAILRKPGRLDPEERAAIEEHPALAVKILSASTRPEILPWILQHHERIDGTGYPAGLSGDHITLEARIMAVCDAYDAITSDRPYRNGATPEIAVRELRSCAGSQFDSEIVELFAELVLGERALLVDAARSSA